MKRQSGSDTGVFALLRWYEKKDYLGTNLVDDVDRPEGDFTPIRTMYREDLNRGGRARNEEWLSRLFRFAFLPACAAWSCAFAVGGN